MGDYHKLVKHVKMCTLSVLCLYAVEVCKAINRHRGSDSVVKAVLAVVFKISSLLCEVE